MRYLLNEDEVKKTVDLFLDKFELSTRFLFDLYGCKLKDAIYSEIF